MILKNKIAAIAGAVVLATASVACLSSQKTEAVETATTYTEYYTMPSVERSHPYASANSFANISKSERKEISDHFASLLMGRLDLAWNNGKIEKVSPLQNGTYTQQIFLPIAYTERSFDGNDLYPEIRKTLCDRLIGGNNINYAEVNWGHYKGAGGWQPGLEDNGYELTTHDIAYTKVVNPNKGADGVENRPFGVTITRTVKDGVEPTQAPAKTKSSTTTRTLKKNAYVYNAKGKRIKRAKTLKKGKHVTVLGKKGKFVRIGKGRYIKKANI